MNRLAERVRVQRVGGSEGGVVLVWFALMLVVLLGMGALGIDVAHLYQVKTQAQQAADAAALAGAVYLPEDPAPGAAEASSIASKNGFAVTAANADSVRPSQMNVEVSKTVDNFLAGVLGISTSTVKAKASAEFLKPVAMGSPVNQFGNDPVACAGQHGTPCYPDFWANIAGRQSTKVSGDRYAAESCGGGAENCPGEYDPFGHVFAIEAKTSGTMSVEIFDPAFVAVGDACEAANADLNAIAAAAPTYGQPAARYVPGNTNPNCTGDVDYTTRTTGDEPTTTYTMRGQGPVPPNAQGSPVINSSSCQPATFTGVRNNLTNRFTTNSTPATGISPTVGFRDYFRRWTRVCQVSVTPGTYYLQVQSPTGNGHNRYAVRATIGGSGTNVTVHGDEHMTIYANAPAANTTFHLARIPTGAANHTLVVDLFDIGDASSVGTLTILPPPGATFDSCTFRKGVSGTDDPAPGCSVGNVSSSNGYQGKINQFRVEIPDDYSCADADPDACWVKIRLAFGGGVNDTTTWSARLLGDPVRITK